LITVLIYGNYKLVEELVITGETGWQYTAELPRYDETGREITYTVDEEAVDGYSRKVHGYDLINTWTGGSDTPKPDRPDGPDGPSHTDKPDGLAPTGDMGRPLLWMGLMLLSILGLVEALLAGRKLTRRDGQHK